jgi:2-succinyl-5-enolpyruvyl-6-hydroxy-3-cyclohexene-1-carboxylate synthase
MPIDFRNSNTIWASILAESFKTLGLRTAIICPGSRSAPLAVAFAQQEGIEAIPVLDERSAAFLALGIAKKSGLPTVLICTSGTAGANFYPAVIEAKESRVPLLILTADRPPEMRECHSGQTIDQVKLYGNYPNWQTELAVPSLDLGMLDYVRQTAIYAWERSLSPTPGVVHLNVPFRDPLAPLPEKEALELSSQLNEDDFFDFIHFSKLQLTSLPAPIPLPFCEQGIIIAGTAQPQFPKEYCEAIAQLSRTLKWPVLADGLSPIRNYADLNPYLISTYDTILRDRHLARELIPEVVIQIGDLPTSKALRNWLAIKQPQRWIIDPSHHNFDPLHGKSIRSYISIEQLVLESISDVPLESEYLRLWQRSEIKFRAAIDETLRTTVNLFEGKAAWLLSQILPPKTPLFIANSMPVRDIESFWKPNNYQIQPFFNRGANGIDGTLSTALGVAHRQQSSVMLTGDLALLHDTNGFLLHHKFVGHLTIILINNQGGGIFEMLPISQFNPPFEEFFATPQKVDFAKLAAAYNIEWELILSWQQLAEKLNPLPAKGIRILELRTNRQADAQWRRAILGKLSNS